MARQSFNHRVQWLPIAITVICTAALTLLLFTGVRLAARLQSASAALQFASGLRTQPQLVHSELNLIQRGLETQTYIGDSLRALAASRAASNQSYAQLEAATRAAGLATRADSSALLAQTRGHWTPLEAGLSRVAQFKPADLYADSATGSALTEAGAALKRLVDELLATQTKNTALLSDELGSLAALLRDTVVRDGQSLRGLLLGGAGLAALLLATTLYFAWRAGQAADAAGTAQRQISNILGTVREGLFLIDRHGRVGGAYSDSLIALLHCPAPAGQTFEDLLRPLVDDKTLLGASKYLGLLWKDTVNEELIESVNPLNQIEVRFRGTQGLGESRYLSFSFRRGRGAATANNFVLGVVADVTDRVLLQRELEQLRSSGDSQATLLTELLRVEPSQLQSFLDDVQVAIRRSNALLRGPGVGADELEDKVQGVFREMHAIKGEAAALGMDSFVQRAHAIEEMLEGLREHSVLTGDAFVPLVVKFDEFLQHMHSIAATQERVAHTRSAAASAAGIPSPRHGDTVNLERMLRRLASEVSTPGLREVRLIIDGLDRVPPEYAEPVRDICIQMVRNAIVHGIEPLEKRAAAGKPPAGTIRIRFNDSSPDEYTLLIEDDGQGLSTTQIRDRALERGLLNVEQAGVLDRSGVFRLIFQPGFSTATSVTEHAGRGVGLDVVNTKVRECGGRIGIATASGKYTRFKLLLPRRRAAGSSQYSAA